MKSYHISQAGIRKARRAFVLRGAAGGVVVAALASLALTVLQQSLGAGPTSPLLIFAGLLALFLIGLALGLQRAARRITQRIESYELRLDENTLSATTPGGRPVKIRREQITRLEERPPEVLLVEADNPPRTISIPMALEGYAEVRAQLTAWRPIETGGRQHVIGLPLAAFLLINVIGISVVFLARSPWIVLPVGGVLMLSLSYLALSILRRPDLERRVRFSALLLFLTVLVIALRLAGVLRGAG
ncbi:MAG: hypothetical protein Kow00124_15590 [Anaerolineae bacterium]